MNDKKNVLISIQPKWCGMIATGKKTVEVRKAKPKIQTPFKCYIYCTVGKKREMMCFGPYSPICGNGKVIGEFICDKILDVMVEMSSPEKIQGYPFPGTGLTDKEIMQYLGNGITGYGWHISELKIYDFPVELPKFGLNRAPQSWCYLTKNTTE